MVNSQSISGHIFLPTIFLPTIFLPIIFLPYHFFALSPALDTHECKRVQRCRVDCPVTSDNHR